MTDTLQPDPARHRGRVKKAHNMATLMLVCTVVVTLAVGLGSVFLYRHLNDNLTRLDVSGKIGKRADKVAPGNPINILVMGSDSRAGDQGVEQMENGGARSDTTMLMHLSSDRKHAYGVSLPRDAVVDRPECTTDKGTVPAAEDVMFNTAFQEGGVACTIATVESLTGVYIDHWVVVNFNGFKDMVDAIGGVEVCIPHAIDDDEYDMHLEAGTQRIRGDQALDYVRVRHGFGDGSDIGRMKRQQTFVASMAAEVVSTGTLTRVDKMVKFLDAATASLAMDSEVGSMLELAKLGNQFRQIGLENIAFVTVPFAAYEPDPNRIVWDTPRANRLWAAIRADDELPKRLAKDAVTAEQQAGTKQKGGSQGSTGTASPNPSPAVPSEEQSAEAEANGLCA